MRRADNPREAGAVSEMAVVDTFTKLIFAADDEFTARELRIIGALRALDANVSRDSHAEMGDYLRYLGVREMIQLVSRLSQHLREEILLASARSCRRSSRPIRQQH